MNKFYIKSMSKLSIVLPVCLYGFFMAAMIFEIEQQTWDLALLHFLLALYYGVLAQDEIHQ